jgi:type I restriction enzyme S subunit
MSAYQGALGRAKELGIVSPDYLVLRFSEDIEPRFAEYLFRSTDMVGEMTSMLRGVGSPGLGTVRTPRVNWSDLGALEVNWPHLAEQRQIADYLDVQTARIYLLIEKQERLIEMLAERRQAVISYAVTKGLDPNVTMKDSGSIWFPWIPAHWNLVPCGVASSLIQTGPFGSQLHSDEYVSGGTPVINPSHIANGEIVPDDAITVDDDRERELARHRLLEGDMVAARRGEMGRCAVVQANSAGYLCGTGSLIVRLKPDLYVPAYFQLIFSSDENRATLTERSIGATMDNLNADIVARLRLPNPPVAEQREIIEYLGRETAQIDALSAKAREMIVVLEERRQALISAAVTGKIDVRGLS